MINEKFGKLVVLEKLPRTTKAHDTKWLCICECGNRSEVFRSNLIKGRTVSCGCHNASKGIIHGASKSKTYKVWTAMKQRTTNSNICSKTAKNYIERGITICDRWLNYEAFLEDMGEQPPGMSIERIDNSRGYCKENCVWADSKAQARNHRRNVNLTAFGETKCITDWSRQFDISCAAIKRRVDKGWSVEKSLTEPVPVIGRKSWKLKQSGLNPTP